MSFNEQNLIIFIQNEPCLYNVTLQDYHDKDAKDNAWARVASKVGFPGK